jgi:hypothetical protein
MSLTVCRLKIVVLLFNSRIFCMIEMWRDAIYGQTLYLLPHFVYSLLFNECCPIVWTVLMLKYESIKERWHAVLRIACCVLEWYAVTVYFIIWHRYCSIFEHVCNFLLCMWVQPFPYMFKNFTICMPVLSKSYCYWNDAQLTEFKKLGIYNFIHMPILQIKWD